MTDIEMDPLTWPEGGRVGYCHAGNARGSFVFVDLETDDRTEHPAWVAYFAPVLDRDNWIEERADHALGYIQSLLAEMDVEWAPPDLDWKVESRMTAVRSERYAAESIARSDSYRAAEDTCARSEHADFGRASTPRGFGNLLRSVRESLGLSVDDVVNSQAAVKIYGVEHLPDLQKAARNVFSADDVISLEAGEGASLEILIRVLDVLDYDIAIIPKRGSLQLEVEDPWSEFRGDNTGLPRLDRETRIRPLRMDD